MTIYKLFLQKKLLTKAILYGRIKEDFEEWMRIMENFEKRIKRVIITKEEIDAKIAEVAEQINASYDGRPILLVSILKGAFVFMADLMRAIKVPCEVGFMCAKSYYNGTVSAGAVKITMDLEQDVSKYHLIIVEDIIDTGRTLFDVANLLRTRNPLSMKIVTFLNYCSNW